MQGWIRYMSKEEALASRDFSVHCLFKQIVLGATAREQGYTAVQMGTVAPSSLAQLGKGGPKNKCTLYQKYFKCLIFHRDSLCVWHYFVRQPLAVCSSSSAYPSVDLLFGHGGFDSENKMLQDFSIQRTCKPF